MKTLAIDCRMGRMSGIGVYIRNIVPSCMRLMPGTRFRLLGLNAAFSPPEDALWEETAFKAPIYSIREQMEILPLLQGCDALWTPHYPIPVLSRLPLVVTVHDLAHLALRDTYKGVQRIYAKLMFKALRFKAAELLFVSDFTRREFFDLAGSPKGNVTVVHNGLDASWLKQHRGDADSPSYFLAVGNIKPHKNLRLLCRAFARIARESDVRLLLVGKREGFRTGETSVETLADICPGRIHFTGQVEQGELEEIVKKSQALIFPSLYEGFGLPPLEALASGVPVIASDIPPVKEVCGEHARYFSPHDEESLSRLMQEALCITKGDRAANGAKGQAHAAVFSWDMAATKTVAALNRALRL